MEGELNKNLQFLDLCEKQRSAFLLTPIPELVRFPEDSCLYKWTEYGLINPTAPEKPITEWWLPWMGFRVGDRDVPGFKELRIRHRNIDGSVGRFQEVVRSRNAVTEPGNAMSAILKVKVEKAVWGFVGLTKWQRAYNDPNHPRERSNVTFIGGDYQLCIPGLTPAYIRKV